ncbi:MAG TPA: M28 family peptidase [Flavobacteriales bacterium]
MKNRSRAALLPLALLPLSLCAQLMPDADAIDQMRYDVQYLASDRLEGRETGMPGEKLAYEYIIGKFDNVGLMPYGDSATYLQAFPFSAPPERGPNNTLQLGRNTLKVGTDFYPVSWSANANLRTRLARAGYGIVAPELDRNDYNGLEVKERAVAFRISSPDGIHPHSKWAAYHDLRGRIEKAISLGANAVILYNDDPDAQDPDSLLTSRIKATSVPVVFLTKSGTKKMGLDGEPVALNTDIQRKPMHGHNVVGLLDNGQKNIVVIGAHYDHLGYGDEGSLHRGERGIHNGADDNASGVAVMLQLARDLKEMPEAHNNDYLFIAFSGEEKGLFGSNWWTKNPTVPLDELNYMINLDMVGRLDSAGTIMVNGVGTSPAWAEVKRNLVGKLDVHTSEGGVGPSDHTSFYLQGIPAIHFFTGSHNEYHKPADDEALINYPGMLRVTRHIESLITTLNDDGKIAFTKTADADSASTPRFTVTLGVVPDYMYDGQGMRIDGVTDGKPAAAAGLKPGDIVVKMGDVPVTDMMSYMKGLSSFKKGDSTKVTVLRDKQEVVKDITFK